MKERESIIGRDVVKNQKHGVKTIDGYDGIITQGTGDIVSTGTGDG